MSTNDKTPSKLPEYALDLMARLGLTEEDLRTHDPKGYAELLAAPTPPTPAAMLAANLGLTEEDMKTHGDPAPPPAAPKGAATVQARAAKFAELLTSCGLTTEDYEAAKSAGAV